MKGFTTLNIADADTASNTPISQEEKTMNTDQEVKLTRSSPTKKQRDASKRQLAKMVKAAEEKSIYQCLDFKPGKHYRRIANLKRTLCSFDRLLVHIKLTENQHGNISKKLKKLKNKKWEAGTKPHRRLIVENHENIVRVNYTKQAKYEGYDFGYDLILEDSSSPVSIYLKRRTAKHGMAYSLGFRMNPANHCVASIDNAVKALEGIHKKLISMILGGTVTSIDCAVDIFNMNIRNFFYETKSLQKTRVHLGRRQELETLEHGEHKNGVCLYDKAAEIRDKPKKDGGREFGDHGIRTKPLGDATRIEIRKQIMILTSDLIKDKYWADFSTLKCYEVSKVHYSDRFFMLFSQVIGLHTTLKMLAPEEKKKVRKALVEAQISLPINNENHVSFDQASLIVRYLVGSDAERQAILKQHPGDKSKYIHCGLLTKQLKKFSADFTGNFNEAQSEYLKEITPNYAEIKRQSKSKKKSEFPIGLPITSDEAMNLIALGHPK